MYLPLAILLVVHRGPNCTPFYNLPPASGLRTAVRSPRGRSAVSSRGSPTRDSALALSSRVGCVLACRVSIRYIPHRTRYSIYLCRDVQLWSLSNSALRTHKTPICARRRDAGGRAEAADLDEWSAWRQWADATDRVTSAQSGRAGQRPAPESRAWPHRTRRTHVRHRAGTPGAHCIVDYHLHMGP